MKTDNFPQPVVTRGYGFLERFLAKKRADMADNLIPDSHRKGRILDIGCGSYPLALLHIDFNEKFGLDKVVGEKNPGYFQIKGINIKNLDLEMQESIPFDNDYFDVVIMLAVFEHIETDRLETILNEVYRILKPGGVYIMTTPAIWTDKLLRIMARLRLVSPVEIEEHKCAYSPSSVNEILQRTNFKDGNINFGYFEMFMNIYTVAIK
ncbi:MAG: class I SAM-dependent methyltransferase [Thermodesulfovibrionia bacterium]|nr:class I SAM-dependent methyltransferase [Thermodesulfovibrionia bacterium]